MSERPTQPGPPRSSSVLRGGACQAAPLPDFDAEFASEELLNAVTNGVTGKGEFPKIQSLAGKGRTCRADQMLQQATELFASARAKEEEALRRVAEIEREAYLKGFQQGETAGLEIGQAKLAPMLRDIESLLGELGQIREKVVAENYNQLVEIAIAFASRILHREVEVTPDQILHTVEEVLARIKAEDQIRLRMSQSDYQHLLDHRGELPALAHIAGRVTFEVDPSLMRGGCLVQTPTGLIDATIETMFAEMRQALTGQRMRPRSEDTEAGT